MWYIYIYIYIQYVCSEDRDPYNGPIWCSINRMSDFFGHKYKPQLVYIIPAYRNNVLEFQLLRSIILPK